MLRSENHTAYTAAQRAREEMGEAWAHLLAAAEHGARQAGVTTRQRGAIARQRATAATMALRGEQPPSPWRWLAVGLAAGIAVGSAGAVILSRRMPDMDTDAVKQRASAAVETVRERTGKVTGKLGGSPTPDEAAQDAGQAPQATR